MTNLETLIQQLCPDGVEYVPLWSITIWDKKFNAVDRKKQPTSINYPYLLANDLFALEVEKGDVFLLSTGERTGWTTEELAGNDLCEGEVVSLPWGKSRAVVDCIKYYKGKFVTADNRIMTSNDTNRLLNKYLYYWFMTQGKIVDTYYRGSGIKHPDMAKVLDLQIPLPPLPIQEEIVRILDKFTALTAELQARRKQYEFYRDRLLTFGEDVEWKPLGKIANTFRGEYITKQSTQTGEIPVILGGQEPAYYIDKSNHSGELITVARSGASAGFVAYWDEPIFLTDGFGYEAKPNIIKFKYLYYILKNRETELNAMKRGAGVPHVSGEALGKLKFPVPPLSEQERIVSILDRFDALCNDITSGLPAEIEARQKQYEFYRDKLLNFTPKKV